MINDLRLQHFRSYQDTTFEFTNGVNILVGPNASGKTNALEAILVLCTGSSYRAKDIDLISFEEPWARLDSHTGDEQRTVGIERSGLLANKHYTINTQKLRRLPFNKTIPVVLFEPEHLRLLHVGPEQRRDFLDELLEKTESGYGKLRRDYRRTLAQRNRLLKQATPTKDQLFAWNVRLSELGGQLAARRSVLVEVCNQQIEELYQALSKTKTKVRLEYYTKHPLTSYSSHLLQQLEAHQAIDQERGFTGHGPHRDDLLVYLDDQLASLSASRGESRTVLLALKMVELRLIEESRGKRPILLLDDVFSELDGARRLALTEFLKGYQTFITTTDADVVVQHFMEQCNIIPMSS
jgi:DNA replication and repair protein RecF